MAKGLMIVFTNPAEPAREDEFNKWYNETHISEILALPGFCTARRYRVLDDGADHRYVAVYEVEADDVGELPKVVNKAARDGQMHLTDAIGTDPPVVVRVCVEL